MVTTRSKTRKAAAARAARKSVAPTRRSSRVRAAYWKKNRCWSRRNDAGAPYTVCSGSKGQKGVYKKKKGRKTRKGKGRAAGGGGGNWIGGPLHAPLPGCTFNSCPASPK